MKLSEIKARDNGSFFDARNTGDADRRYLLGLVERMRPLVKACGSMRMREQDIIDYRELLKELGE